MRKKIYRNLLSGLNINPILVDIGASGGPPNIWKSLAPYSIYVGFEPDLRGTKKIFRKQFHKTTIINKAVTNSKESDKLLFYLTKSHYCSSTLQPNNEMLSNYFVYSNFYSIENKIKVQTTTLNSVMKNLSLPIDWLKIDSQGTDIRIFKSLNRELSSHILALTVEPGLYDFYIGEDSFSCSHKELTKEGFWLSNMHIGGSVRMKTSVLHKVIKERKDINPEIIKRTVKPSPTFVEARYLRTTNWLRKSNSTKRDYALLWIFAVMDNQFGFALEVGYEYEKIFGKDNISKLMKNGPIRLMKNPLRILHHRLKRVMSLVKQKWMFFAC